MCMDKKTSNLFKFKILDNFIFEAEKIFNGYFESNSDNYIFKNHINRFFDSWKICRLDLRNLGGKFNSVNLLNDESFLNIKYPTWLDDGKGCVIESDMHFLDLNVKCYEQGNFKLYLRGVDFRVNPNNRIPTFINFKKLSINNQLIFDENKLLCHDEPFIYNYDCNDGEKLEINVEFKTIFDYFPKLLDFQNKLISESADPEIIKESYNQMDEYIFKQKLFYNNDSIYDEYFNLKRSLNELKSDFNNYQIENNKIIDSYNLFFDNIFKFHKLEPTKLVEYSRELNNQLLDFIDNVCKNHNLEWWIDYGVLLGAVRHGQNIPWDDDYDVSMLRADYNKFFNVIHDEIKLNHLENNLHVNLNKKGPNNSLLSFIKMEFFDNGRLFGFVDIFPYDYITQVRDGNVKKVFYDEHYKFMADLKNGVDRDVALSKYFDLYNVSEDKTDILIVGIESFRYNQINYDTLFPLKEIKFENHYYPCPNNSKDFLRQEYGDDFMKVPKIAYNHGFYDALMRYDDVYDVFEKHISRFKEINKKLSSEL